MPSHITYRIHVVDLLTRQTTVELRECTVPSIDALRAVARDIRRRFGNAVHVEASPLRAGQVNGHRLCWAVA
jgi:hypothetical protein